MVPFVLTITRRMRLPPLPYLLAVATASNIGSVATITGNPQNMLIGSFSGIKCRDFLWHLGPVAVIGLFLDWAVLHWVYGAAEAKSADIEKPIPLPPLDLSRLSKPVIVVAAVVTGFFMGAPPAMMAALGAAVLLITRTLDPHKLYEEVDWGLLVFFVGLFLIVGGAENAGIVRNLDRKSTRLNSSHVSISYAVSSLHLHSFPTRRSSDLAVVTGFFMGAPPAMMAALGAAVLLITRTLDPHKLYEEVDWGLLVFFVGLFLIVGGAENAGIVRN